MSPSRLARLALVGVLLAGSSLETATAEDPAARHDGAALYRWHCAPCHAPGMQYPGTHALEVKYEGKVPAELAKRSDLTPEFVRYAVRSGTNMMPFYRRTELDDNELSAIVEFLTRPKPGTVGR